MVSANSSPVIAFPHRMAFGQLVHSAFSSAPHHVTCLTMAASVSRHWSQSDSFLRIR